MSRLRCRERDNQGPLRCPKCDQGYNPEWNTEYGDPEPGEFSIHFSCCNETFKFETTVEVSYAYAGPPVGPQLPPDMLIGRDAVCDAFFKALAYVPLGEEHDRLLAIVRQYDNRI